MSNINIDESILMWMIEWINKYGEETPFLYKTTPNNKTILENAIEYCEVDVLAMKQVWIKFKKLLKENLNMIITKNIFTLSQLCMKLMEASLPPQVKLYVPKKEQYIFIKNSSTNPS